VGTQHTKRVETEEDGDKYIPKTKFKKKLITCHGKKKGLN
jgi:hypothetical protein